MATIATPFVWSFEPVQLVTVLLAGTAYSVRAVRLARRGRAVSPVRAACFAAGLLVLVLALVSPVDALGEQRLFCMHMCQHVLIGDVAPFLLVLGLTGPLLRPVLAVPGVYRVRALAHPLVALPLWAFGLAAWHVPYLYDAALAHPVVHAFEHASFLAGGALVWAVLFEVLPGPRWFGTAQRAIYLAGMWFFSLGLSSFFLWWGHPLYAPYVHAPRTWGLTALADQRIGGGVMLLEGSLIMLGVLIWLGVRWFAESEAQQRLLDAGVDVDAAARAVRYGRAWPVSELIPLPQPGCNGVTTRLHDIPGRQNQ